MRSFLVAFALVATAVAPLEAQVAPPSDPGRATRTRADLERLHAEYQSYLLSPAYSEAAKQAYRRDVAEIERRLREGDFRPGDRIAINVQGEAALPDTVSVESGPMISLPNFGSIPLEGVLRSEIEAHLTVELSRFIRTPIVRARGLMQVTVLGAVGNPGFHHMPADISLGDALMMAGGPDPTARTDDVRIERGGMVYMEGEEVQNALQFQYTLDQLNLQAGDQITVPAQAAGGSALNNIIMLTGVLTTLAWSITQIFG